MTHSLKLVFLYFFSGESTMLPFVACWNWGAMASACGRAGEWKQAALAKLSAPVWCGALKRRAKWSQLETRGAERWHEDLRICEKGFHHPLLDTSDFLYWFFECYLFAEWNLLFFTMFMSRSGRNLQIWTILGLPPIWPNQPTIGSIEMQKAFSLQATNTSHIEEKSFKKYTPNLWIDGVNYLLLLFWKRVLRSCWCI